MMKSCSLPKFFQLVNGAVVSPEGIRLCNVDISQGKIIKVGSSLSQSLPQIDISGHYLLPGLVDIHIHGRKGRAVTDPNPLTLKELSFDLLTQGITSFAPTGSATEGNFSLLENVVSLAQTNYEGAEIIGVHMEGPFLNPERRGAQPAKYILPPTKENIDALLLAGKGWIKHFTIAPEVAGGFEAVRYLADRGLLVSIGHTIATYEETMRAIELGARLMNHFFNGMVPLHHREIGTVGAGLLNDLVSCELICDGLHVDRHAIELTIKNKGYEKVCMVSDNTLPSGLPYGDYQLPGKTVTVTSRGNLDDKGSLSGSQNSLFEDFVLMVQEFNHPIHEVVKMSSLNPAKLYQIDDCKGSIEEGKDADLLVLTPDLKLREVYKGLFRYLKEENKK